MIVTATPSPNLIWGGYAARRVLSSRLRGVAKVFGVGAADRVADPRRVALAGVKGHRLASATAQMAVFRRFLTSDHGRVAGCSVAGSQETTLFRAFEGHRRLMGDYRGGAVAMIEAAQLAAAAAPIADPPGPPSSLAGAPTPVASATAGLWEKFRIGSDRPLLTLSAVAEQAKTIVGDRVRVREASPAAEKRGKFTRKSGPGAGLARAEPFAWRRGGAAIEGADFAGLQSVAAPVGVKGEATLCVPWTLVN